MEFEGRAARRPMPRQMDMSDWNVDVDVRSGVSSSVSAYQRDRSAMDVRSNSADTNRRVSSGEELRSDLRNLLRPVNRYDMTVATNHAHEESPSAFSSWRLNATAGRTTAPSSTRLSERLMERDPSSQRLQPRSIPDTRRIGDSFRPTAMLRDADGSAAKLSVEGSAREGVRRSDESALGSNSEDARPGMIYSQSSSIEYSPPREQYRQATPPSTIRSDASTALTSSPFTPSILDTPPSLARTMLSSPYTPSSDDELTRHLTPEATSAFPNHNATQEPPPSPRTQSSIVVEDPDPPSTRVTTSSSRSSTEALDRPTTITTTSNTLPPSNSISPRQQREQLYDFRRDMRQVFARVDEMVDLHRDMFKCDVFSGMPEFNAVVARETASFANETFGQLSKLRERFEEMTTAWARAVPTSSDSGGETPPRPTINNDSRRTSESSLAFTSISTRSPSSDNQWSAAESSVSSDSPTASSQHDGEVSHRAATRSRWEPTLSTLSNGDDSSSSTSSAPASDACSSSLPSELPTLSRPSTATSSAPSTRANVFEDFDKRMEEIRASLNAMARDKPRPRPSPRSVSTRLSTATFKSRGASDDDDDDPDEAQGENNARVGNRVDLPWRQRHDAPPAIGSSSATTRHDREARLRQLLRELQTTGEQLDAVGDGGSRA